jgi:hypothetical protein
VWLVSLPALSSLRATIWLNDLLVATFARTSRSSPVRAQMMAEWALMSPAAFPLLKYSNATADAGASASMAARAPSPASNHLPLATSRSYPHPVSDGMNFRPGAIY